MAVQLRKRLFELVSGPDGKLSRTQITLNILLILSVCLIIADVAIDRELLSYPVMILIGIMYLSALLDRINARCIDFKLSKEGAAFRVEGNNHA